MRLKLNRYLETARSSLFLVPMVAVVLAVLLGQVGLWIDARLDSGSASSLPSALTSTVESARAVLSTVAGATISFAGIAFSVSLLIIQLGSSQYSPRVVHTLFRDPFNKRVMGLVVGTFTFSLIVLRSVRSPFENGDDPVIPNLSVAMSVVLGVASILAIVAFINHSAHSMDISEVLERVAREAIDHAQAEERLNPPPGDEGPPPPPSDGPSFTVRLDRSGWIQQIDLSALADCAERGATVVLHTAPGRYAVRRTPLCTVTPAPNDGDGAAERARSAVVIGETRTMQQDPSYGIRQLVDVALKALSPGVNDPTTAQDAIFHIASVLGELLHQPARHVVRNFNERRLVLEQFVTHGDLVSLAFDEVRRAARDQPLVCVYLLESLGLLHESLGAADITSALESLEGQARLVLAGCEAEPGVLASDLAEVHQAFRKRFGEHAIPEARS